MDRPFPDSGYFFFQYDPARPDLVPGINALEQQYGPRHFNMPEFQYQDAPSMTPDLTPRDIFMRQIEQLQAFNARPYVRGLLA